MDRIFSDINSSRARAGHYAQCVQYCAIAPHTGTHTLIHTHTHTHTPTTQALSLVVPLTELTQELDKYWAEYERAYDEIMHKKVSDS